VACPACGHANPPASRFCNACGQPLRRPGPSPGAGRLAAPDAYTPRHLAERILESRAALEGERKQVTVLFADLKASMELLADRDPEEARKLLDPVLDRMMEAVHRYEGTVNQVMGDGIMALFGAPLAHEDHAVRACYAALRMLEQVGHYGDETQRAHGVPIQIRVGVNSGDVVVRSIGSDLRMDYTAVGQTTHLAARMEQMAKPGSALLTGATLRLAEGYVEVKPLGPIAVRGLAEPVVVFELTGAAAARTRLQVAAARGLTRFVGRNIELEQLRQALERTGSGHGQVVAIVGEAGVGKSRLVWELTRSHRAHGWLVLESSAVAYGTATPFLPLVDLLHGYFGIDAADDERRIREKLTGKLLALDQALRPMLPAFKTLLELPADDPGWDALPAEARRREMREAIRRLLLREAQVQPLLVVLEDLHWADAETLALLDSLVESLPAGRVLLLVNYRPDYRHGWTNKTYYTQVRLDPLASESAEHLLRALLGSEPTLAPLASVLIERTQGNPFYLEESVRSLVETNALLGERGAYRLAGPSPTIQIPATVQAVLAARIDRLAPDDKRLLQCASVIGKDVPLALLRAVTDLPEETVAGGLTRLQAGEFLYEARLFPEAEYAFRHPLTLDVAYGSLLQERRRELHVRILKVLERAHADRLDEHASRLLHHAFRGEAWSQALRYLHRTAATEASRSSLDAALGGAESPATLWWTGAHQRAITVGHRDLAIGSDFRSFGLIVVANCRLGHAYHALGDYSRAAEFLRRAAASLQGDLVREQFGMASLPAVFARTWLAWSLAERGEFDEGRALGEEAVALADAADHAYSRVLAAWGLGTLYLIQGELERAQPLLERGLVMLRVAELPLLFPFVAGPLGAAYALAGRPDNGRSLLDEAIQRADAMTLRAIHSRRFTWLGEALAEAGRLEPAAAAAARAVELAEQHGERGDRVYAARLVAELDASRGGAAAEAVANAREALAQAEALGMQALAARCRLTLGRCLAAADARGEARAEMAAAVGALRALVMPGWLARAERALADLDAP
jgi:class 3 adenylate cyclase/tetratricopeptide (TPR) repeat protein